MNKTTAVLTVLAVLAAGTASAKDINIQSDTSGLPADKTDSIARTAIGLGVKEPLVIKKTESGVNISGAGAAVCNIKLAADGKILGVSCK